MDLSKDIFLILLIFGFSLADTKVKSVDLRADESGYGYGQPYSNFDSFGTNGYPVGFGGTSQPYMNNYGFSSQPYLGPHKQQNTVGYSYYTSNPTGTSVNYGFNSPHGYTYTKLDRNLAGAGHQGNIYPGYYSNDYGGAYNNDYGVNSGYPGDRGYQYGGMRHSNKPFWDRPYPSNY